MLLVDMTYGLFTYVIVAVKGSHRARCRRFSLLTSLSEQNFVQRKRSQRRVSFE